MNLFKTNKTSYFSNIKFKPIDTNSSFGMYSFENVFSYQHICEASALCKRNVGWKASVQNYMRAMFFNSAVIYHELHNGTFEFQKTNEFYINERGKRRHIKSVKIRDRVVQKALCNYCLMPLFKPTFIYDNCASLKNKGISFAIRRLKVMLQKHYHKFKENGYVLNYDFKDYFGSINHDIALEMMKRKVKDEKIIALIKKSISVYAENHTNIGIGLGSELSQFIALLFANPIDHLIKDKYGFKHYIRYMDDGIIISEDKEKLKELLVDLTSMCDELGLTLNMKKTHITPLHRGFTFLKKRVSLTDSGKIIMRISRKTVTRMRRKLRKLKIKLENGEVQMKHIEDSYTSWRGFIKNFDTYSTITNMDNYYKELFGYIPRSKEEKKIAGIKATEKRFKQMCDDLEDYFEENPYQSFREQYGFDLYD